MRRNLSNSHMFYAYHMRSAFLVFEQALREMLKDRDVTPESFYVLRCDWTPEETAFDDIRAHAILSKEEAIQSVNTLIAKGYLVKGAADGFYALSPQGRTLRTQLLEAYHEYISKATEGLSEKTIETALSSLLKVQNNLQLT